MVKVSELRISAAAKVSEGRSKHSVYDLLHHEIEAVRSEYRETFINDFAFSVDYVHEELVRTLANEDPALLGPNYPGPLA